MPRVVSVAALSLGLTIAIALPPAGSSAPGCAKQVRAVPLRLPASVQITTPCAVYTVSPAGRVTAAQPPRVPAGITWMQIAGPGAAVVQRGERIAVLRSGRELWRSTGRFRAAGVFATVGPRAVAFSYQSYARGRSSEALYLAPLDGPEHQLAGDEQPLGWTADGRLLTWRSRGESLLGVYARAADGTLISRVGERLREVRFQPAGHTLLALSRAAVLERYNGRWRRLADLRMLGFGKRASFEPLAGGLIGVLEGTHVAVLRSDGSLFASMRFRPRAGSFSVAGQSGLVANTAGSMVAFTLTAGDSGGGTGRESLYLLRAGDRTARELYTATISFAVCERWASLDWQGDWLLYATTEGRTLALDSRAPNHRVDLTPLIARLAATDSDGRIGAQVRWAPTRAG